MKKVVATLTVLLITAGTAMAQNGKVPWKRDPQSAMAEAKKRGMGMMLYFTSEG